MVVDAQFHPACRKAAHDFRDKRKIGASVIDIDGVARYWQKPGRALTSARRAFDRRPAPWSAASPLPPHQVRDKTNTHIDRTGATSGPKGSHRWGQWYGAMSLSAGRDGRELRF
ncbi:MAG: TylF/MycF/NovP-related O-methyltransferase [Dongiaceae bacterium]